MSYSNEDIFNLFVLHGKCQEVVPRTCRAFNENFPNLLIMTQKKFRKLKQNFLIAKPIDCSRNNRVKKKLEMNNVISVLGYFHAYSRASIAGAAAALGLTESLVQRILINHKMQISNSQWYKPSRNKIFNIGFNFNFEMESWDDEDFEPSVVSNISRVKCNKWEGEDEEEDVKESWEDEEEEEKEPQKEQPEVPKPKKKTLAEKIAEKERLKREEIERRLKEQQEEDISPEEKIRQQKESDLKIALETTFGGDSNNETINGLNLPSTKEEFHEFTELLSRKIIPLSKNSEYPSFTENLVRNLCATLNSFDIKKIKNTVDNLYLEKQKIEKGEKTKKNKGKGKAKLKVEGENQLSAYVDDYDEFDDFM